MLLLTFSTFFSISLYLSTPASADIWMCSSVSHCCLFCLCICLFIGLRGMSNVRYRPNLPVEFFQKELAFADRTKCVEFLQEKGVTIIDNTNVDCKANMALIQSLQCFSRTSQIVKALSSCMFLQPAAEGGSFMASCSCVHRGQEFQAPFHHENTGNAISWMQITCHPLQTSSLIIFIWMCSLPFVIPV